MVLAGLGVLKRANKLCVLDQRMISIISFLWPRCSRISDKCHVETSSHGGIIVHAEHHLDAFQGEQAQHKLAEPLE